MRVSELERLCGATCLTGEYEDREIACGYTCNCFRKVYEWFRNYLADPEADKKRSNKKEYQNCNGSLK